MASCRSLIAFLFCTSLIHAAETTKLRTLSGKTIEGELVRVSDQEIVIRAKDGPVTVPLKDALDLDFGHAYALGGDSKYSEVELTDGSLLHCTQFAVKKNEVELKLVGGIDVQAPLSAISYWLSDAQDAKVRDEWQALLAKRGNQDILAIKDSAGTVNRLDGTFGAGDEQGTAIEFETSAGTKRAVKLTRIHAMSFLRKLAPNATVAVCKVHDTSRNVLAAVKVAVGEGSFTVQTASGIEVKLTAAALARVDYSQGKLTYLSDLEPTRVVESSNIEGLDHYRRDKNLDNGPIRVGKEFYAKGLALHAYTELVYDLGGQYKEFKAVVGADPQINTRSDVKVTIEADGQKLFEENVKQKDNPQNLIKDVRNVKHLRIVVRSNGLFDLGGHVNLADARVSK
jgi:hypothetical protein